MVQNDNIDLEIILALIKKEFHVREIARIIEKNHSTVIRKISKLAKENVIDYRQEGRNKIFFIKNNLNAKNYVYSAEIYKLNKLLKKHPELSIIFEEIKRHFRKGMIILFGSYVKGNEDIMSDIDVYLETMNIKIKNKINKINSKLRVKIGKFDINSLLVKEIIKNHIIIRGAEEFYEKNIFFKEA